MYVIMRNSSLRINIYLYIYAREFMVCIYTHVHFCLYVCIRACICFMCVCTLICIVYEHVLRLCNCVWPLRMYVHVLFYTYMHVYMHECPPRTLHRNMCKHVVGAPHVDFHVRAQHQAGPQTHTHTHAYA